MANPICFFNKTFCHASEITLKPFDTGFLYGESVYDVVPFIEHTPLWLDEHVAQWHQALHTLKIVTDVDWHKVFQALSSKSPTKDGYIYVQASTGVLNARSMSHRGTVPTLIAIPHTMPCIPKDISAVSVDDNIRCHTRHVKHTSKFATRHALSQTQAQEIIYSKDDFLLEGGSSNLFMVDDNKLITPPTDAIYAGITRKIIIDIAQAQNIPIEIGSINRNQLKTRHGLFLTGSIKKCLPIRKLDTIDLSVPTLIHDIKSLYDEKCQHYVSSCQTALQH